MKDIIKFALQMEKDGKAFYERAAQLSDHEELRDIFNYLAEEEDRHFNFFKKLSEGKGKEAEQELDNGQYSLEGTKNVFIQLTENNKTKPFGEDVQAVWKEAKGIEERAVELYTNEADKEDDPERKKLLERIAEEERNHVYLIDNVLSYMTDPQGFVDSKDFADFQSWEGH